MAIIDFFDRGWRHNPAATAFIQDDRRYSYSEIGKLSCQIANGLLARGFKNSVKGAVWSANDVTAWACTLGLWRANLCWIPVGARNGAEENCLVLDAFDCEILFFQKQFAPIIAEIKPRLPKVKLWICIDGHPDDFSDAIELSEWSARQPGIRPDVVVDLDDVIALMPTGGTTGTPKGVMNTHRVMQTFCAHMMLSCSYESGKVPVNLVAAPMTHTAGVLSLPTSARCGTVIVVTKPDPALLLAAIPAYRVTEFFLPPTVIYRLLDIPDLNKKVDFSSLKYFMYGAAPMSVDKLKQAIAVFGPVMMGGYGQTECPATISMLRPDEHVVDGELASDDRLSSVGRPSHLIRVEIMNEANEIVDQGETGEICVRGDLVMRGYYKAPDKTAEAIVNGWLHTGDIGHLDTEGYLHITDRKKDMIITGGFNVYPSEVEQVIWSHPAVQDCAVIGVPDEKWGEAVKAVVELNEQQTVTAEELISLCKERLGSVKSPKTIEFIPALPRSPVGKVLKKELRAQYWQNTNVKI